jgi:predicted  nucleic acid-binding Zn-ribbon protein
MVIRAFEPAGKTDEAKKLEHTLEWYERTAHDLERELDRFEETLSEFEPEREREHDAAE